MTAAGRRLLTRAVDGCNNGRASVYVDGNEVEVARSLERAGLGRVGSNGWLLTFAPNDAGRDALKGR